MAEPEPLLAACERFLTDPAARADAAAFYRRLHAEAPVLRTAAGLWLVAEYEGVVALFGDDRFRATPPETPGALSRSAYLERYLRAMLPLRAPADHERVRRRLSRAFTWRMVQRLRPRIEAIVDRLLDRVVEAGRMDVVADLAHPLPVSVSCAMLGVPEGDHAQLIAWTDALTRHVMRFDHTDEVVRRDEAALRDFVAYVGALCAARRAAPVPDDLISALVAPPDGDGDRLDETDLTAICMNLLIAGHETATCMVGNTVLTLLRHPEALARVAADPGLVNAALDECLRLESPVRLSARTAAEDLALRGHPVRRGDTLLGLFAAANRDPARYPEPDRFDLAPGRPQHLAFGWGSHFCLGHALARAEGQVVLERFLARLAEPSLAVAPDELTWETSFAFHGVERLPIAFTPAPAGRGATGRVR